MLAGLLLSLPTILHQVLDYLASVGASAARDPVQGILQFSVTAQQAWEQQTASVGPIISIAADIQRCVVLLPADDDAASMGSVGTDEVTTWVAWAQLSMMRQGQKEPAVNLTEWPSSSALASYHRFVIMPQFAASGLQLMAAVVCRFYKNHELMQCGVRAYYGMHPRLRHKQHEVNSTQLRSSSRPRHAVQPPLLHILAIHQQLKLLPAAREQCMTLQLSLAHAGLTRLTLGLFYWVCSTASPTSMLPCYQALLMLHSNRGRLPLLC